VCTHSHSRASTHAQVERAELEVESIVMVDIEEEKDPKKVRGSPAASLPHPIV
jgi:hypothetical protein